MEHLKILAEKFAELSINKKFPVEKWLKTYGVGADVLFAYDYFTVDFNDISLKYDKDEWTITGKEAILNDSSAIERFGDHYQQVYEKFLTDLPGLKSDYVRKLQEQFIELQEELNQAAA